MHATKPVAQLLAQYFKLAFPDCYQRYSRAFDAGVWELADPGPWLGRAIVYKMQVGVHVDGLDGQGPTAAFPVGWFEGGEMYLPDLGLKFRRVCFLSLLL